MTGAGIVHGTMAAVVIAMVVLPNNRAVAYATRPDAEFPFFYAGFGASSLIWTFVDVRSGDWVAVTADVVVVAMCARIVWSWWRRRRQGKPSKVLGLVQDVGHKLAVVNVPAEEGT